MAQTISKIGIKSSSGTGYDTRDIGAKCQNVEVGYDTSGKIILDVDSTAPTETKTLTKVLQDAEKNIGDLNTNKAADNHAWSDADTGVNHGLADNTHYGHIKVGDGLTVNSGKIDVAYGNAANTACQGNDVRLSNDRKNPNSITFDTSGGDASGTTYDGSEAKTVDYSTIGAAPAGHTSIEASDSILGHVKTGTGLTNNSGTISVSYGIAAGTACQGNDPRLTNARPPLPHAVTTTAYGGGDSTYYGHVKVTDSYETVDLSATAANSVVASAYALQSVYNELKSKGSVGNEYKDITSDFDNGTFSANLDKYNPGNYIKKTYDGITYVAVLADFNTFRKPLRIPGDSNMIGNDDCYINLDHWTSIIFGFGNRRMNSTDTTKGGYKGSEMHEWLMNKGTNIVINAFGDSHLVPRRCLLSSGTYSSSSATHGFSNELLANVYLVLPSEAQLGYRAWSDLGWSIGEAYKTLDIFKNESCTSVLGRNYGDSIGSTSYYNGTWLRDISVNGPNKSFCCLQSEGYPRFINASVSSLGCHPLAILR